MKNFDTRTYSLADFQEWNSTNSLILSPDFQRRAVWTTKAKSYLIDTVLRSKPMPKIIITQKIEDGRNIRTVVDGQQRLRALLEYINDDFVVSKMHNATYGGLPFSELPDEMQQQVLQYELGVDVLFETNLSDILDIFSRLNTYSVKLNSTELLNATYVGSYKTRVQSIARRYVEVWRESKVITPASLSRMAEIELAGDLYGIVVDGIQSKKNIANNYKKYDDIDPYTEARLGEAEHTFDGIMKVIIDVYDPQEIALTNYRRVHLYYSLFCVIAAIRFNCIKDQIDIPSKITHYSNQQIRVALDNISALFDEYTGKVAPASLEWAQFITDSRRATTDSPTRIRRAQFIVNQIGDDIDVK